MPVSLLENVRNWFRPADRVEDVIVQLMSGSNVELLEDVRRIGARHGLNMRPPLSKPFAEGLESAADLQAMCRMGCDIGRGFYLARPMPKSSLVALLEQHALQLQPG